MVSQQGRAYRVSQIRANTARLPRARAAARLAPHTAPHTPPPEPAPHLYWRHAVDSKGVHKQPVGLRFRQVEHFQGIVLLVLAVVARVAVKA